MDRQDFERQISALRSGELVLEAAEHNGLSRFAAGTLYEMRQYISALEAGYRTLTGRLAPYEKLANERALGRIVKNQWSKTAALGYAAAALRQTMNPSQTVGVLELMEELMEEYPRDWAEDVYKEMVEDPGGENPREAGEEV